MSIVIPCSHDEPAEWVQELVATALKEANDVWIVCESEPIATTLAISGTERLRVRAQSQPGGGKASALNDGLEWAHSTYITFIDSDVRLKGGEISAAAEALEAGADFVAVGYGSRPPPFPIISFGGGWFFGAKRSIFAQLGGWQSDYVEDAKTTARIKQAGFKITMLPFAVEVRRGPRRPLTKLLSAMFAGGR